MHKIAIITGMLLDGSCMVADLALGASSGIGLRTAKQFVEKGVHTIFGISIQPLNLCVLFIVQQAGILPKHNKHVIRWRRKQGKVMLRQWNLIWLTYPLFASLQKTSKQRDFPSTYLWPVSNILFFVVVLLTAPRCWCALLYKTDNQGRLWAHVCAYFHAQFSYIYNRIGTNHIGHFLLTQLLLDDLIKSAPSRVIVVAARSHDPAASMYNVLLFICSLSNDL